MGSTTFHRFWDRPDGFADIDDMGNWSDSVSLTEVTTDPAVVGGEGESVVLLAKGDVFRLYPNLTILLRDPSGALAPPVFGGTIPPATRFFAFDVDSVDEVLQDGWFVRFQEQPTEPRFGVDGDTVITRNNAADFAASAYQRPFALEIAVSAIVGEGRVVTARDFETLDPELPLALLPVRLETRFFEHRGEEVLGIRIYPDTIHAGDHHAGVTEREIEAGRRYWEWVWGVVDPAVTTQARTWLASQVGPHRAVWVAEQLRPQNADDQRDGPQFPKINASKATPTMARLMPDTWMLRLHRADGSVILERHVPGPRDGLVMAPSLTGTHDTSLGDDPRGAVRGFLADQSLAWTLDFDAALRAGMAIRVPAGGLPPRIATLVVVGLRTDRNPLAESAELVDVLDGHRYRRGLDLVPQGTPTNNSDAGRSGISLDQPDIDGLFEWSERPGPGLARGLVEHMVNDPATLYVARSADAASLVFGYVLPNALDHTEHALWADGAAQWAMNLGVGFASLGGAIVGPFYVTPNEPTISNDTIVDIRNWYLRWVRGGAALPTLRCGEQPYGLLPVMLPPEPVPGATDFAGLFEDRLAELLELWLDALPVPALDPDASDARPSADPEDDISDVAAVLGAVPHPTALQLRTATDWGTEDRDDLYFFIDNITGYLSDVGNGSGTPLENAIASQVALDLWNPLKDELDSRVDPTTTIDSQYNAAATLSAELPILREQWENFRDPIGNAIAVVDQQILPLLQSTLNGTNATSGLLDDLHGRGGVGARDKLKLASTAFSSSALALHHLVTGLNDLVPLSDLSLYFYRVRGEMEDLVQSGALDERSAQAYEDDPLLAHLLDVTYTNAPEDELLAVGLAFFILHGIVQLASSVSRPDPNDPGTPGADDGGSITTNPFGGDVRAESDVISSLERVLRESLGLAMYRLDAWVLSLANERLATLRKGRPHGIQLGAFGWLVDLEPGHAPVSQGFVHAPTLNHAATAAVLRAGWSAYGTSDGDAPLSVDLSSDRVRRGLWILDGLRSGQDLSEMLGARFERLLHDAKLDAYIAPVREHALAVAGEPGPANAIVDGLLVARAGAGPDPDTTEREQALADVFAEELATATGRERREWRTVMGAARQVNTDLDSMADLVLFQSVHSLLQGDAATAGASTAIASGVDADIPRMSGPASPRDGQRVSHRVTALLDPGANGQGIGNAAPGTAAWIRSVLPAGSSVVVGWRDASGGDPIRLDLAALDVDVVSAALLAGAGVSQTRSDLGRVIAALAADARGQGGSLVAPQRVRQAELTLDEFGLVAARLLDALGRCRPLRADDLVTSDIDVEGAIYDVGALDRRLAEAEGTLVGLRAAIAGGGGRRAALATVAALGISGAVTALEIDLAAHDPAAPRPDIDTVLAGLDGRLASLPTFDPPTSSGLAEATLRLDALRALTGSRLALSVPFTPVLDPAAVVGDAAFQVIVAETGPEWLRQVGRVRPDVGAVDETLLLAGSLGGPPIAVGALQHPAGVAWVATGMPATAGEHVSVLSVSGLSTVGPTVEGLLFDAWGETIPRSDQVTGIAVHFDAPGARPPQSILLASPRAGEKFSANMIAEQLLFTLRLAKVRALGPDDLGLGQVLPGVFLDGEFTSADDIAARGG